MSCSWNIIKGLRRKGRTCTAHMSCHTPILALLPCFHPICITPKRIISLVSLFVGFSNDSIQCICLEPRIKQNYTEKREWLPAIMKVGIQADKAKPWYTMSICIQQIKPFPYACMNKLTCNLRLNMVGSAGLTWRILQLFNFIYCNLCSNIRPHVHLLQLFANILQITYSKCFGARNTNYSSVFTCNHATGYKSTPVLS